MTNYATMEDKELLGILDNAHDWACPEVEPCFRILCDRHGIDYDNWDFGYYGCDGLYDLFVEKVEGNK